MPLLSLASAWKEKQENTCHYFSLASWFCHFATAVALIQQHKWTHDVRLSLLVRFRHARIFVQHSNGTAHHNLSSSCSLNAPTSCPDDGYMTVQQMRLQYKQVCDTVCPAMQCTCQGHTVSLEKALLHRASS